MLRTVTVALFLLLLTACAPVDGPDSANSVPDSATTTAVDEETTEADTGLFDPTALFPDPPQSSGEILCLYGHVLDVNGDPVPNATVEIWQTDSTGVYDHPGDPGTEQRDRSFQFYGSTQTAEDGSYAFRTVLPGLYEPRPRHIHFKVKTDGETLLTSQFYFSEDVADVQEEAMVRAVGSSAERLMLQLVDDDGSLLANGLVIVDTGIGDGPQPLTPAQGEGPYYPVVSVIEYDNDLTIMP